MLHPKPDEINAKVQPTVSNTPYARLQRRCKKNNIRRSDAQEPALQSEPKPDETNIEEKPHCDETNVEIAKKEQPTFSNTPYGRLQRRCKHNKTVGAS